MKKWSWLIKPTLLLLAINLTSRLLGFIRLRLLSQKFGLSEDLDFFFLVYHIPDMIFKLLHDGLFLAVLVPAFIHFEKKNSREDLSSFLNSWIWLLSLFGLVFYLGILIFKGSLFKIFLPGFSQNQWLKFDLFFTNGFGYVLFIGPYGVIMAFLHSQKRFFAPALSTVFFNLFLIAGIFLYPDIPTICGALTLGGALQLLSQLPSLFQCRFSLSLDFFKFRKILLNSLKTIGPWFLILLFKQGIEVYERTLMSYLVSGSISQLTYALKIFELPTNFLTLSIVSISFTKMATDFHSKRGNPYEVYKSTALLLMTFMIPISLVLFFQGGTLLNFLFSFKNSTDLLKSSAILSYYSLALIPQSLFFLQIRTLFALEKVDLALKLSFFTLVFQALLLTLLFKFYALFALPLAFTLSLSAGALPLLFYSKPLNPPSGGIPE